MAGYIEHNFENHPAISAEYVKFLATNSGYDKVEKMEIIVAGMKDNVTKAQELADKAAKKAEAATDKYSAANKEIEAMKKRIQILENKAGKWRSQSGNLARGLNESNRVCVILGYGQTDKGFLRD